MSASNPSLARAGVVRTSRAVRSSEHGPAEPVPIEAIEHTIRHSALRGLGFAGLLGIALIHLLDVIGKMNETPYLGVMYILLMVASISVGIPHLAQRVPLGLDSGRAPCRNDPDRVRPQPHDRVAKRQRGHR